MRTRLDLLVISALALYRLWRLVARDTITEPWRARIYDRWPPTAARALYLTTWNKAKREVVAHARQTTGPLVDRRPIPRVNLLAASIDCPWCAPTLVAGVVTVLVDASFGLTWPLAWWGALAALVGLLGRIDAK